MKELLGRLILLSFRASSCRSSIDRLTFSKTSTTGTSRHSWLKGAEIDAPPTASAFDFLTLRFGLGEFDACDPPAGDGELLTGMNLSALVRLALLPGSETSGVGGEPNKYGLVVYCRGMPSALFCSTTTNCLHFGERGSFHDDHLMGRGTLCLRNWTIASVS